MDADEPVRICEADEEGVELERRVMAVRDACDGLCNRHCLMVLAASMAGAVAATVADDEMTPEVVEGISNAADRLKQLTTMTKAQVWAEAHAALASRSVN